MLKIVQFKVNVTNVMEEVIMEHFFVEYIYFLRSSSNS